jgi:peptidoglycan/LPS O-acetylase OafA/YrhL
MNERITRIDSWRAICCLGVLWIHCWGLFGNPVLPVAGFNAARLLAILGNGVDFFFVISGFCMYYFYYAKLLRFNLKEYTYFLFRKRWVRIAPAFYLTVLVYAFLLHPEFDLKEKLMSILVNFSFIHTIFNRYELAGHFWSIAVEWQFYILFPLLVYLGGMLKNFNYALLGISLLITLAGVRMLMIDPRFDLLLPVRFLQFAAGLYMAKWFIGHSLKNNCIGWKPFVCGIFLMGIRRILNSAELLYLSSYAWYYAVVKVTGYGLLAFGFSIVMTVSLKDRSWWYSFLDSRILARIGEISYSFYLWHGISYGVSHIRILDSIFFLAL